MQAILFWMIVWTSSVQAESSYFLQSCTTESNPDIHNTILELKKTVFTTNCQEAWERLQKKTEIHLPNKGIQSLKPFAEFVNLRSLDLWGNDISSLDGLQSLENLTQLWIGDNKISSLEPIKNLKNLKILMAWKNKISDLRPIQKLPIQEMDIQKNPIKLCPAKPVSDYLNTQCRALLPKSNKAS